MSSLSKVIQVHPGPKGNGNEMQWGCLRCGYRTACFKVCHETKKLFEYHSFAAGVFLRILGCKMCMGIVGCILQCFGIMAFLRGVHVQICTGVWRKDAQGKKRCIQSISWSSAVLMHCVVFGQVQFLPTYGSALNIWQFQSPFPTAPLPS